MLGYPQSFRQEDRERVFGFLALFSRWECALKNNGFARPGTVGQAEPNWRSFAQRFDPQIAALNSGEYLAARTTLLTAPPRRQEIAPAGLHWVPNPRRANEVADAVYLLRVVRDVRNNLFHGGKFANDYEPERARDRTLIDAATVVLEAIANVHHPIYQMLDERI